METIEDYKYYMNPHTGSIDLWKNWAKEQKETPFPIKDLDELIEMVWNPCGEWIEADSWHL